MAAGTELKHLTQEYEYNDHLRGFNGSGSPMFIVWSCPPASMATALKTNAAPTPMPISVNMFK